MSRTTVSIKNISNELNKISGLTGIVSDKVEELEKQVKEMVCDILENHTNASCLCYNGYPRIVYGVEQSNYGHCYRWIFEKSEIINNIGTFNEDECCDDCGWPIGGSNSSATYITKLCSEEEIRGFLLSDYKTDYDDPTLIDIAEGICTIATDENSITSLFVNLLNINEENLTKDNFYYSSAAEMIKKIEKHDILKISEIDYDNPFYGKSRHMRLSKLEEIFKAIKI